LAIFVLPKGAIIASFNSPVEFEEWIRALRRQVPLDRAVRIVAEKASTAEGNDYRFLANELRQAERDGDALQVLDELLLRYPDDVHCAITKANIYFYSLDQPVDALKWIDLALERANRTLCFRREVLGSKARILLKLGRGDALSDVLEEIMSLQIAHGVPDIGRERDFVDRAPPGLIRKNVLERYNEFRPRRPSDTTADEPPPFSEPDDAM
jgi:tetratricopeptide (TPR) repeat protein